MPWYFDFCCRDHKCCYYNDDLCCKMHSVSFYHARGSDSLVMNVANGDDADTAVHRRERSRG